MRTGPSLRSRARRSSGYGEAVNNAVKQIKLPMTLITPVERAHIFAKRKHRSMSWS